MLTFPVADTLFIVIDAANVREMKNLNPLIIKTKNCTKVSIVVTPDCSVLEKKLKLPISADNLADLLEGSKYLPDRIELTRVDGVNRNEKK
jgi:hypothetical protein